MNLKGLDKVLFDIYWTGNVKPDEIDIDRDDLYDKMVLLLDMGPKTIDARGVMENPEHTPALIFTVDLLEAEGMDYVHYAIKVEIIEYVEMKRLGPGYCKAITWEMIKFDMYEKRRIGKVLNDVLYDLAEIFVKDYNVDNPM
jgi:hypothetical protein